MNQGNYYLHGKFDHWKKFRQQLTHFFSIQSLPHTMSEAAAAGVSCKKLTLKISENSQENTRSIVFCNFTKKRLWHRCFPVNFPKFLRTPFLTEHCQWLLLIHYISTALLPASNYMFNVWHTNIKLLTKSNCLLYAVKFFLPTFTVCLFGLRC